MWLPLIAKAVAKVRPLTEKPKQFAKMFVRVGGNVYFCGWFE